jgi:hypothetical protein
MAKRRKLDGRHICKCECGGQVRGIEDFGRLFTWCEKCTPVTNITTEALDVLQFGRVLHQRPSK